MSSSRTRCSSSESTSFRVELTYCDSTTRHADSRSSRALELPPHCVQIVCDTRQPLRSLYQLRRHAPEVGVVRVEPRPEGLCIAADDGVEASVYAQQEQRELALLALQLQRGEPIGHPR